MRAILFIFNDEHCDLESWTKVRDIFDYADMPTLLKVMDDAFVIKSAGSPDKIKEVKDGIKKFHLEKYGTFVVL